MLKTDIIWSPDWTYTSKSEWEPVGFFSDGLCNAKSFDLMLGFFSSSAINVLSDGFATFLHRGGKMRLIINDILSTPDKDAIIWAEEPSKLPFFDLKDIAAMKDTLSKRDKHFFECLAWLIRYNRIDIRIVRTVDSAGIAHTKCGVFSDGENMVGFSGSANFSYTAFIQNYESLSVYCDWNGTADVSRISSIQTLFNHTFAGDNKALRIVDAKDINEKIVSSFGNKELCDLLEDEKRQLEERELDNLPSSVLNALTNAKHKVQQAIENKRDSQPSDGEPKFPYPSGPREYQTKAFENWKNNRQKGLFAMATGTGKTITSLNCLLQIYESKGYYKALILVPTITLVNQWEQECRKFNFDRIIKISSKNSEWRQEVSSLKAIESHSDNDISYIFIATYASFVKESTFSLLNSFSKKQLLLIADEAHNMGSNLIKKKLGSVAYIRRIGLSATPERQYDDDGNAKVFKFFGAENGYTFEYSMKDAIGNGVLCRYYYFPHIVELTDDELQEYIDLSAKIAKYYNLDSDSFVGSDSALTRLLLKRKRIVHKAANKKTAFRNIIERRLKQKGNLRYTLVYVPEGNSPDYAETEPDTDNQAEDYATSHLIDEYSGIISDLSQYTTVRKFTSESADRDEMLKDFASGKVHVLTSMKCLDEGVDVPRSELAIFCSSTGNPRQFIQRRGRILRTHPDKSFAVIHDLIVAPKISYDSPSYNLERSLVRSELIRVKNFAMLAENTSDSSLALESVMQHYNLNLFNNTQNA